MPSKRSLLVPFGLATAAVLYLSSSLQPGRSSALQLYLEQTAPLLFLFFSAWFAHKNASSFTAENPVQLAWRLLSLGLAAFFAGDLIYAYYKLVLAAETPLASVADLFYVAYLVLLIAAEIAFLRAYRKAGLPIDLKLDVGLVGLTAAAASLTAGTVLLRPVFQRGVVGLGELLTIAYPLADLVILSLAVILFRITWKLRGGTVWQVWLSLVLGFLAVSVADLMFTYLTLLGHPELQAPSALAYLLGYIFFVRGGLKQLELLSR